MIRPTNGYGTEDLLRLARGYGDQDYLETVLQNEIDAMTTTHMFHIYAGNKMWTFSYDSSFDLWWCLQADVERW